MMRSMYSGVSGLKVHQTKMDVISNNISNINTIGFKRSSVSFKDSFTQTLSSATAASADSGGSNPQQVGMGANVGAVSTIMKQGAAQRTDYGSDLMIDGEGFFIVQDGTGFSFTRAGAFEVDAKGNLVGAGGARVCGWKAVQDPNNPGVQNVVKERVTPINIYEGGNLYSPAVATSQIEFSGNFDPAVSPQKNTLSFYDSQGNKYTVEVQFTKVQNAANQWNMTIPTINNVPGLPVANNYAPITVNGKRMYMPQANISLNIPNNTSALTFKSDGTLDTTNPAGGVALQTFDVASIVDEAGNNPRIGGAVTTPLSLGMSGVTQFRSKATVTADAKNGNTSGSMTGYNIDSNGIIKGVYSNGQSKVLGQIPLATFKNPAGLEKYGSNMYKESSNSSEFDGIGSEISAIGSKIQSGALEMSNVDISQEFSDMIVTQRGFQANSRIISASDEMIQDLVNLKR